MELFHKIVIIIAIVIFVISLTWFGIQIHSIKTKDSSVYPPTFDTIPDYWTVDAAGLAVVPTSRNAPRIPLTAPRYDATTDINLNTWYTNNPGYTPGLTPASGNNPATVNFADPAWKSYGTQVSNRVADCIYKEWANRVGVTWDGISNYTQCVV